MSSKIRFAPRSDGTLIPRLGIVVTQKDERELLRSHVQFHLQCGVVGIVVVDNESSDPDTLEVLHELQQFDGVIVLRDLRPDFDQEAMANEGLATLISSVDVGWVMSLDVDEFLHVPTGIPQFLKHLSETGVPYGAVRLTNNIPDRSSCVGACEPSYLATTVFYTPELERQWQELGHLAKAICRVHCGMRVAVGNHYFYHEPLQREFPSVPYGPVAVSADLAVLLHYEMRDAGRELLQKWGNLASRHRIPGAPPTAPWWEKRDQMRRQAERFANDPEGLYEYVVTQRRTLWDTVIAEERIRYCSDVALAVQLR